jgi:hypothetical protein
MEGNVMNIDFTFTLIIGFICIIIGFAIGRLLGSLRETKQADSDHPEWDEVILVWRHPRKDNLIVKLGGDTFERGTDLDTKSRKRIHQVLMQLHQWLDPEFAKPPGKEEKPDQPDLQMEPPAQVQVEIPSPVEKKTVPQVFNPRNALTNAMLFDIPDSAFKADSIVEQIDNILQLILKETKMEDNAIRLMDMPNKGMVVMIGLDLYEEIDDIPDLQFKNLIRQAVWLWENRKDRPED